MFIRARGHAPWARLLLPFLRFVFPSRRLSMTPSMRNNASILYSLAATLVISAVGCVDRTLSVTSEPSGALLYLNDEEIGRTPCTVAFTFHGTYDVRLVKDGHETLITQADTRAPIYDIPPLDLVAEITPARLPSRTQWHFRLLPVNTDTAAILDRARQMRAKVDQEMPSPEPAQPAPSSPR